MRNSMHNVELVTDELERAAAAAALDQSGFDALKEELGPSRDASLARDTSLEISYDEKDLSKVCAVQLLLVYFIAQRFILRCHN